MSIAKIILFVATLSFGAPVHACNLDGGFGMHRFNPFQAAHSGASSSSWNDALIENRQSSRQQEAPAIDAGFVEKTLLDQQKAKDIEPVAKPLATGGQTERVVVD